ncbi:MAG TPA: outer membrane lipoprotein-sorting protein [Kiritimatiellia bacterium]|nr:outer membrane lipoprotein-sorting protein [Kiritimatiellia bacterium]HRZ13159.1 outer membrane lipoprotein-sorting protein [Kiritimatiellia bacterium]HSA17580.1 outer membrane lipoprotein-sorting protein [Kiritimatiellia bacterium]
MNRGVVSAVLVVWAGAFSWAAMDEEPLLRPDASWPDAVELVQGVVAGLPDVPVRMEAQLQSKDRRGTIEGTLNAEMKLDWYGQPPSAEYRIRDAFGAEREALRLDWSEPGRPVYRYSRGEPPASEPLPDLYRPIEGTDISWIDLSLSFLWWPGGRTVGMEKIKGRMCYIVEMPAPAGEAGGYAGVRLWIEPRIRMMLQAAAFDAGGEVLRLVEVKSFKKVRDLWLIQNLDVQTFPGRHRTSLRVRHVAVAGEAIEEGGKGGGEDS